MSQWDASQDVYYRVYRGQDGPVVLTMQWFDEFDYDEARFLDPRKFECKADAEMMAAFHSGALPRMLLPLRGETRDW